MKQFKAFTKEIYIFSVYSINALKSNKGLILDKFYMH